jgi:endonuclease/exonuclease/phosphatase (EEP) superfamily protein YafD
VEIPWRAKWGAVWFVGFGMMSVLLASILSAGQPAASPDAPRLVVMTYNLNYGLAGDRATLDAISAPDADVVFLQETNATWESVIRAELSAIYPHMSFIERPAAGGQALLSKHPFEENAVLQEDWFPAGLYVIETPLGEIQALNVHLRPGFSDDGGVVSGYFTTPKVRRREVAEFYAELDPAIPTLIAGDFNESHGKAMKLLKKKGLKSATPKRKKTWRWKTRFATLRGRLDHIVHDARLRPIEAKIHNEGRSDHLPVVVTFVATE